MVILVFLIVGVIISDRIIYARQSRNNITHKVIYVNKETKRVQNNVPVNDREFHKIVYQFEEKNNALLAKFVLHILTIVLMHIIIFWYFVLQGNSNLVGSIKCDNDPTSIFDFKCNFFQSNFWLQALYLLSLFYFFFSALQIKFGFFDIKDKALLMRNDSSLNSKLFKGYLAIPFLFEI